MSQSQRFAELLSEIAREVTVRQSSEICCGDLTLEQFRTLKSLAASSARLSLGALSEGMQVDLSTMSRNVTVLERSAYVRRVRSTEDGRVVHICLTSKGRRALDTLCCGETEMLGDVFAGIPPVARAGVLDALALVKDSLTGRAEAATCCPPGVSSSPCAPARLAARPSDKGAR